MKLTTDERQKKLKQYEALKKLIEERQAFEKFHANEEPYRTYPTDMLFPNVNGWNLLHLAAILNDLEAVKNLVEAYHVDIKQPLSNGKATALFIALLHGNIDIAKYLINHGASIGECTRHWLRDMPESLDFYDEQARLLLQQAKQNPDIQLAHKIPNTKRSYLDLAAEIGDLDAIHYAHHQISLVGCIQYLSFDGENLPAHRAVENNQKAALAIILDKNVSVHSVDSLNQTALHQAIFVGNWDLAKELLDRGANINDQDIYGKTPLYYAIYCGEELCARELLRHGADPKITTYDEQTIYHAQAISHMDLTSLIPQEIQDHLQSKKNIYGQNPDDYAKNESFTSLDQNEVIDKIKYYLALNYRDKDFFSDGYCNGLSFLFHFYDSHNQLNLFYKILEAWVNWDGTGEALQKKPGPPLDEYKSFSELFEESLSHFTVFQSSYDYAIRQWERDKQLALVGNEKNLHFLFKNISPLMTRSQLIEMLTMFSHLPKNTRIEVGGGLHATAIKVIDEHHFMYFDPNFKGCLATTYDVKSLADLIIQTKYKGLRHRSNSCVVKPADERFEFRFSAYSFHWEQISHDQYNYFSEAELPKSKEEADDFIKLSPNGLSHLEYAILSLSIENVRRLVADGYCDVNRKGLDYPYMTALERAYQSGNSDIVDILLSHPNIQLNNPPLLEEVYRDGNLDFIQKIVAHKNSQCLHGLFNSAAKKNDMKLLEQLFDNHKIDRLTTLSSAVTLLNDKDISEDTKKFIYKQYQSVHDDQGNALIHVACSSKYVRTMQFILQQDQSASHLKNHANQSAIELFCEADCETARLCGPNSSLGKFALFMLDHLPLTIDCKSGFRLFDLLHSYGEPYCSRYVNQLSQAVNVVEPIGESLFKITLLEYFTKENDAVIVQSLLAHMNGQNINHQHGDMRYTALHYAVNLSVHADEEKKSRYQIVKLLIEHQADLDVPDVNGISCRQIIERSADPDILMLLQSRTNFTP